MPISYAERKQRRQFLQMQLIPELRSRIALRNVEAANKLSLEDQRTLAKALHSKIKIAEAIGYLIENPEASVEQIVLHAGKPSKRIGPKNKRENSQALDPDILEELTNLLLFCYPEMPRVTAEAMAAAEMLSSVREILRAHQAFTTSPNAQTEFVIVVLYGFLIGAIRKLDQVVFSKPAYLEALKSSGVRWLKTSGFSQNDFSDWEEGRRSDNA